MLRRRRTGDDEDARPDDAADADHGEMHRPQRAVQFVRFGDVGIGLRQVRQVARSHRIIPPLRV